MKQLAIYLLLLLWTALAPAPAIAQFGGCLPAFCEQTVATCGEATTFLARTSGLNTIHQNAYRALICGLVSDGILSKLDALYTFATQDQTIANLNLVSTNYTTVPQSSPAWATDRGYTGVEGSTTKYLFNGFAPPGIGGYIFTTNNAHISVWSNSSGQSDNYITGVYGGVPFSGGILIRPRNTSDKSLFLLNNLTGLEITNTDGKGLYAANMSGGNLLTGYKNGLSGGTLNETAGDAWGGPLPFLAINSYPGNINSGGGNQISAASIGGTLTATDHANLYTRLRTYMTAVGVP